MTLAKTTLNGAGANTFGFALSSAAPVTVQPNPATNSITVTGVATVTSPTVHTVRAGGNLTITENSVPAGWPANPVSVVCTDSTSPTPTANIATQSGNAAIIPASALVLNANITCTFTNALPTTLRVTKVSNGGTATFGFSGNNGVAAHSITTTAAGGAGTTGAQQTLTAAGTATAITENAPPAGWVLTGATCTVTPFGGTAAPAAGAFDAASRTFNLTAADTAAGNAIACTFTNNRPTLLTVTKVSNGGTATFGFSGNNGIAAHSITTTAAGGAGTAGAQQTLTAAGTATAITEDAPPAGWVLANAACTVTPPGGTAAPAAGAFDAATRTFNLTAADTAAGNAVACTFTNNRLPVLTLAKTVVNDNGGTAVDTAWTLTATGPATISGTEGQAAITAAVVPVGTYTLSETGGPAGYALTGWACTNGVTVDASNQIVLALGQTTVCTATNNDQPARLTLQKTVTNDNGGTAVNTAWTLSATGPTSGVSGAHGSTAVTNVAVDPGTYALAEANGPAGYAATGAYSCVVNAGAAVVGNNLTLAAGDNAVCTITNDDQPARLTLQKTVVNDNGGAAVDTAWTLTATGPTNISGTEGAAAVTNAAVNPGNYTLAETGGPAGYTATGPYNCVVNGGAAVVSNSLTLAAGANAVCTITNDDPAPTLQLAKAWGANSIANDVARIGATTGGANNTAAFTSTASTAANSGAPVDVAIGNVITLPAETMTTGTLANYTTTVACTGGHTLSGTNGQQTNTLTITSANAAVCTYTNTRIAQQFRVSKTWGPGSVAGHTATVTTTGGTNNATFTSTAATATNGAFVTVLAGDVVTLPAETFGGGAAAATYTTTVACAGGSTLASGATGRTVTIAPSTTATTCTYTNTPVQPRLTLIKQVINDNGGTVAAQFWTLRAQGPTTINGATGASAVTNAPVNAGNYVLSESHNSPIVTAGYAASQYSCVVNGGTAVVSNNLTLVAGDNAVCTITNDDRPVTLNITKITQGGAGGPFTFTVQQSGTSVPTQTITTTAAGAPGTTAGPFTVRARDTLTITETGPLPAGWVRAGGFCAVTQAGQTTPDPQINANASGAVLLGASANVGPGATVNCTFTNRLTATLQLAKAWAADSQAGDVVSIGATTGGANNTASFTATAPNAANSGAPVVVNAGDIVTLPAEGGANVGNYTTTLACTGGHTLSGTDGQVANTLTITSGNAAVCTYTNTLRTTDLSITKTNTPANGPSDQAGDTVVAGANTTYRLVVTNNAAADVTGAVVRDTPQAGLNCPAGNAVTCSGAACPGTAITVGDLANGVTLGLLAAGASATLEFSCAVQ
ncbi:hypothetical protein D9T17_22700 [Lysobacter enzymogenes]|uniref:Uncharacterized protein n=1 Tax=Lysobacter enzymogenes TaxID=69 RepID=A0A3N2RB68_LYSEN|nr:hypothetical protein D9T17_22700 [Lysobacter enzymogenes]